MELVSSSWSDLFSGTGTVFALFLKVLAAVGVTCLVTRSAAMLLFVQGCCADLRVRDIEVPFLYMTHLVGRCLVHNQ